ncbi:NADP-binding protein [Chloroflexota bacterium]
MEKIRTIVYGIGAMGSGMVRLMLEKDWIEIVGGINRAHPDPKDRVNVKVGKDLGEVAGVGRRIDIIVSDDPGDVLTKVKANLVLHATSSPLSEVEAQIIKCVEAGCNVISVAEVRLVYPWVHNSESGHRIDEAAKKNGVTVLFTGINPGFMMDLVPIMFTGVCASVRKIAMWRLLNISPYGPGVLNNFGVGLTVSEFEKGLEDGSIGWLLPQTSPQIDMICDAIGWRLDETKRVVKPMTSIKPKKTSYGAEIGTGKVCGVKWSYFGIKDGETPITFDWIHMLHPKEDGLEPEDRCSIEGESDIDIVIKKLDSGVGTYAHAVNAIPQVLQALPGLVTVRELPVAAALP